jgi:hypothetical protein
MEDPTYIEWLTIADEKTVAEMPASAGFPEQFVDNGLLYVRSTLVFDTQGDGERLVAAYYSNERGRAIRIEV